MARSKNKTKLSTNKQWIELAKLARKYEDPISREAVAFFLKDKKELNKFFKKLSMLIYWKGVRDLMDSTKHMNVKNLVS